MARAVIDADTHARLRDLVISHNEAGFGPKTKVGELQKVFRAGWWGEDPAGTAMARVERHLARLAKANGGGSGNGGGGGGGRFQENQHPRDDDGRFTLAGRARAFADVAERRHNERLKRKNDGYRASQTQVIPETRYSQFGPVAAAAVGVGIGAARGGAPRMTRQVDRAVNAVAGRVAHTVGAAAAHFPVAAAGKVSDTIKNVVGRKPPIAERDARTRRRSAAVGRAAEATVKTGLRAVQATLDSPARLYHELKIKEIRASGAGPVRRAKMNADRHIRAAAIGAVVPGTILGAGTARMANWAGPYLDAAFPRRVEKAAGTGALAKALLAPADPASARLLSQPGAVEVLQKREAEAKAEFAEAEAAFAPLAMAALPASRDALAKAGLLAEAGLAKAMGPLGRKTIAAAARAGRRAAGGGGAQRSFGLNPDMPPGLAPGAARPRGTPRQAAAGARADRWETSVRTGTPAKVAVAIGAGAAAAGVAGGAVALGQRVYYRDEDGKFTSKERAVAPGAAALAGAAAGALAGLAIMRGRDRAALGRIAEQALSGRQYDVPKAVRPPGTSGPIEVGGTKATVDPDKAAARVGRWAERRAWRDPQIAKEKDQVTARAKARTADMRKAADDPVQWNEWLVARELNKKTRGLLNTKVPGLDAGHNPASDDFWEAGQGNVKKQVLARMRRGEDYDDLLTDAQKARVQGLRAKADAARTDYAKRAKAFEAELSRETKARDAAIRAGDRAKKDHDAALEARKAVAGEDDTAEQLRASHAEAAIKAKQTADEAAETLKVHAKRVSELEAAKKAPRDSTLGGTRYPQPKDPWKDGAHLDAMPSASDLDRIEKELADEAMERVTAKVKTRGAQAVADAKLVQAQTAELLRGRVADTAAQRTAVERAAGKLAARVGPHYRKAKRDLQGVGGHVGAAVRRKMGDTPDKIAGYARAAGDRAKDFVAGKVNPATNKREGGLARRMMEHPRILIGTVMATGSALGAVELYEDGRFKVRTDKLKDLVGSAKKSPPMPVYRVFNPGDAQRQVILSGVVVTDKKTGKSQFLSGTIKRGTGDQADEQIPINARLDEIIDQINGRNRGGNQPGQKPVLQNVDGDKLKSWGETLKELRSGGNVGNFLDGDLAFEHRKDGVQFGQSQSDQLKQTLHNQAKEAKGGFGAGYRPHEYHEQLARVFDLDEAPLLNHSQRVVLVQGGGNDQTKGVFSLAVRDAYSSGDRDKLFNALKAELGDANKTPFVRNPDQARNLKRAVRVLSEKAPQKLSDDHLAQLDRVIDGHTGGGSTGGGSTGGGGGGGARPGGSSGGGGGQQQQQRQAGSGGGGGGTRARGSGPPTWAEIAGRRRAELLDELGAHYDLSDEEQARQYDNLRDQVEMHWATLEPRVRADWDKNQAGYSQSDLAEAIAGHVRTQQPKRQRRGGRMNQSARRPAGQPLRKAGPAAGPPAHYDESKHTRAPKGSDRGGEFAPKNGGGAGARAGEGPRPGPARGTGGQVSPYGDRAVSGARSTPARAPAPPKDRGFFEPRRFGAALGTAAGSQAGWELAGRFLPPQLRTAGIVGRVAGKLAWRLGAGVAGGVGGAVLGDRAGKESYALAGRQAPGRYRQPERPVNEESARLAGGVAGGVAGMVVRAPLKGFAVGVGGQLAGEEIAGAAQRAIERRYGGDVAARAARGAGQRGGQAIR